MSTNTSIIVTTPYDPDDSAVDAARRCADAIRAPYASRGRRSIAKLRALHQANDVIIVGSGGLEWHTEGAPPFFFHPGMSVVRAKRLLAGDKDTMLEASVFKPGDQVLDCTAGLASDAIVFSFAGGEATKVTAIESEWPIYFIVSHGLQSYESELPELNAAMRRIRLVHGGHLETLRTLPDRSVDIVYFDPMFQAPVGASSGIGPLRSWANRGTIQPSAIDEAKRVARKSIVLKERRDSADWDRLGFEQASRPGATVGYGVIRL